MRKTGATQTPRLSQIKPLTRRPVIQNLSETLDLLSHVCFS